MDSRSSPAAAAFETQLESPSSHVPPPPPRGLYEASRLRRDVVAPPSLNTSVPFVPHRVALTTPLTTTGLSSPFALPSATAPTGGPPSRGISPAAAGMSSRYNVPYDPRHWASGVQRVNNTRRVDRGDDGEDEPPPPYTGPPTTQGQRQRATSSTLSPSESNHSSVNSTPVAATPVISPSSALSQRMRSSTPNAGNLAAHGPHGGQHYTSSALQQGQHGSLHQRSDTLQPSLQQRSFIPSPPAHPPTARRAASAGPAASTLFVPPSAEPPAANRSVSQHRSWLPGMPLPGPPPGPPPAAARSQSASSAGDRQAERSVSRPRNLRRPLHHSTLDAIPPTPANWSEEPSNNTEHIVTSRIDVANSRTEQRSPRTIDTSVHSAGSPNQYASLSRKVAVRDPLAKGLSERRNHSRPNSIVISPNQDIGLNGVSTQSNPWAEALAQSSKVVTTNNDDRDRSLDEVLHQSVNSGRSSNFAATPNAHPRRTSNESQQTPPSSPPLRHPHSAPLTRPPPIQTRILPTPPLSQKAPHSAGSFLHPSGSSTVLSPEDADEFMIEAVRRHQDFLDKEREALSELERLQLFMDYAQEESRIRKERYFAAFESGQFDVEAARKRLFSTEGRPRRASARGSKIMINTDVGTHFGQAPVAVGAQPARPETMWWKDYRPALSPIASNDLDEMSSRGRAPSRWWESQTGSQTDDLNGRVPRSKRESKYMSLSKQVLQGMDSVIENEPMPELPQPGTIASAYPDEKANPEAFGFYDEETSSYPESRSTRSTKASSTALLDISRFITLPPPYPRHYPAVNNNHPDLTEHRQAVRNLSDLSDVRNRRSRQKSSTDALRNDRQLKITNARRSFRSNIQMQIEAGNMTYAEAAEAETSLKEDEHKIEKEGVQAEFDTLQDVVINPLHDVLNERVTQLSDIIDQIQRDLFTNAENQNPDLPMQEGDDFPELLEKLTLLKWLFEAREQLHKEIFDLLSERNDAYMAIVVLPYQQINNNEKVRDTEAFFQRDAANRYMAFCGQAMQRHEEFLGTIEQNVQRGIELQSSAFWDLAPMLLDLLQKIPRNLDELGIAIPEEEYAENPSYFEYPQKYLYTLLTHAEKSSYQFIESQVNLQCLAHEVKTLNLQAQYRALQAQSTPGNGAKDARLEAKKEQDEAILTSELKNRASMIEEQWQDALGGQLHDTMEYVKVKLQEQGVWEQMMEEADE